MPYLEYVNIEYANSLIDCVSPDVLFPSGDSYNTEPHAAVSGNNSWHSVTDWLGENKLDRRTVQRNKNDDEDVQLFTDRDLQPNQNLNKTFEAVNFDSNDVSIRFDNDRNEEDAEKAEKQAEEVYEARKELDTLLNDPYSGYLYYIDQLKKCGGDPANEEKEYNNHTDIWDNCIDAFRPDNVKKLQDALDLYNKKTKYTELYTPKMQALTGLVRGITKLSIELQQKAAERDVEDFNTKAETADFTGRAEQYKDAMNRLKEHSRDKNNKNVYISFDNISQDLKDVTNELEAVRKEKKEYTDALKKIEDAPDNARRQKGLLNFQIAYFKLGIAASALQQAKDQKAPQEKISELENARRNAHGEAVRMLNTFHGLSEIVDPQDDFRAKMDIELVKKQVAGMKEKYPNLPDRQIYEKLIENGRKAIEAQNAVIEKAEKGDDPEKLAIQECLKAYEAKEDYLSGVKDQLSAANDAYQNLQENFGKNINSFEQNAEYIKAYKAAKQTCGLQRIDALMKRMQDMYDRIERTREDGHSDSNEFSRMKNCLKAAAAPENGKKDKNGKVAWKANENILKNIQESAEHYLSEKEKGFIHRKENVMRNYRMTFARDLIDLAKEALKYEKEIYPEKADLSNLKETADTLKEISSKENFDKAVKKAINPHNLTLVSYQSFAKKEAEQQTKEIQKTKDNLARVRNQNPVKESVSVKL